MTTALTGDNTFDLSRELKKRVQDFITLHGDLAVERVDGEEASFDVMLNAAESQPFLSPKKLVVLRRPSANKDFLTSFETVLNRLAETNDLIIFEPKLDKRTSYYKQLKKIDEFVECSQTDARDLPSWAIGYAKLHKADLSPGDARFLTDRLGANQQLLAREIEKLITYDNHITRQNIELLSEPTPQSTIFQLLDEAFSGNVKRALALYADQRQQRVEPLAIVGMIAWQVHLLAIVKTAGKKDPATIASESKASPYVIQKTKRIAGNLTLMQTKSLVRQVANVDLRLKTTAIDADSLLTELIMNIAQMR